MHNPLKIWAEHSLNRIPSKARRRRIAKATRAHDSPTAVAKLVELESILTGEGAASSEPATRRVATRLAPRTVRGSPDTMKDVALLVEQLEGGRVRVGAGRGEDEEARPEGGRAGRCSRRPAAAAVAMAMAIAAELRCANGLQAAVAPASPTPALGVRTPMTALLFSLPN
jgi:hypothetical protein